ncbi:hypothetical protein JHK85_052943 [Glycine max]|nr:hypothetical protein JHK85_052943 [Glycine max]
MCETKNAVVNSEAETSSGALQSEREACVVSEMKNNAVESEAQPSVDVNHKKTNAVDSEAELSVKGGLSVESEGSNQGDEDSRPASDALDGQNVGTDVVKNPFYYLIRVPRYDDDENIKENIKNALLQVEEKTKIRYAIRIKRQTIKEIDSVQSIMNRLNNAISVGDIDGKIRSMEHMIEHETLPVNKEKQLIREIKQLKQNRDELTCNMKKQDQSQQSIDNKDDNIEEHFKLLKKEMEVLRNNVLKSDTKTKAAKKKYNDEYDKLNKYRRIRSPNRFLPAVMIIATPTQKVRVEIANMASDSAPIYRVVTKAKNKAKKPPATPKAKTLSLLTPFKIACLQGNLPQMPLKKY